MTEERELAADGVTVRKSIDSDDFPVPAVTFEITSEREEPAVVRLVDRIPESFPMDKVGFHPDYESEHWTAYPDQRVEFERQVGPGESVTTVYGVRLDEDDEDLAEFLGEPDLEALHPDTAAGEATEEGLGDATMADIAPPERTEVVRDVIEGERDTVPGLEDGEDDARELLDDIGGPLDEEPADPAADADPGETTEAAEAAEANGAVEGDAESDPLGGDPLGDDPLAEADGEAADSPGDPLAEADGADDADPLGGSNDDAGDPLESADEDAPAADEAQDAPDDTVDGPADEMVEADAGGDGDAAAGAGEDGDPLAEEPGEASAAEGTPGASPGNVAAALAEEIEAGRADEETLATLRDALGTGGVPNSVDTRVSHLQSRVSDLEAYADAIEEFIDENGTAAELLERVETDLDRLADRTDRLEADLADDLDERMAEASDQREALREDIADLEASVEESVEEFDESVADLDEDVADLAADLSALEDRLGDVEADLSGDVETVEEDVAALREDLTDIQEWRDQLTNVLGAGGPGGGE